MDSNFLRPVSYSSATGLLFPGFNGVHFYLYFLVLSLNVFFFCVFASFSKEQGTDRENMHLIILQHVYIHVYIYIHK